MEIEAEAFSQARIGNTSITVQDLIDSLCDIMDGMQDHDIQNATGLSDDDAARIANTRAEIRRFWNMNR